MADTSIHFDLGAQQFMCHNAVTGTGLAFFKYFLRWIAGRITTVPVNQQVLLFYPEGKRWL